MVEWRIVGKAKCFALEVRGESMKDADTSVWVTRDILQEKDLHAGTRKGFQAVYQLAVRVVSFTKEHDLGLQVFCEIDRDSDVQAVVRAFVEPLADLQVWVYHRPEVHYDTTQEILALLIDVGLQQVIHGAIESSHDSQIIIAAQLLDADTRQVVCRDVSTDADLALTVTQLLLDADLRLEVQAIQTEASLRQIVTNAFETDADVQITVAEWQGDFDLRLRIGGVVRQESHRIL